MVSGSGVAQLPASRPAHQPACNSAALQRCNPAALLASNPASLSARHQKPSFLCSSVPSFFDRSGCGYIKVDDMRRILGSLGLYLPPRTVKDLAGLASDSGRCATEQLWNSCRRSEMWGSSSSPVLPVYCTGIQYPGFRSAGKVMNVRDMHARLLWL